MEFIYLDVTRMPGENYRGRFRFLLCSCEVFRALLTTFILLIDSIG